MRVPSYGWQDTFRVAIPLCSIISEGVFYTYILESISNPARRYTGHTTDLKGRLREHNAGNVHTPLSIYRGSSSSM